MCECTVKVTDDTQLLKRLRDNGLIKACSEASNLENSLYSLLNRLPISKKCASLYPPPSYQNLFLKRGIMKRRRYYPAIVFKFHVILSTIIFLLLDPGFHRGLMLTAALKGKWFAGTAKQHLSSLFSKHQLFIFEEI